jgi:hypothetical protein
VENGLPEWSVASMTLASAPSLPPAAMQGHVMPSFPHTLIVLGPFANLGCQIVFTKTAVSVIHPEGHGILKGWQEQDGPRLWRFPLKANKPSLPVTALADKYEEPGPRGSAANFFPQANKPSLPVTALPENYEEPGPCRGAADFSCRLSPAQFSVPLHFPRQPQPVCSHQLLQHKPIPVRGALPLTRPTRPAWLHVCTERPRPWH